jgi:hypothetical protein
VAGSTVIEIVPPVKRMPIMKRNRAQGSERITLHA